MKNVIVLLLVLGSWLYGLAALAAWAWGFPFTAIAWTGLILIAGWAAYDYFNERWMARADCTG